MVVLSLKSYLTISTHLQLYVVLWFPLKKFVIKDCVVKKDSDCNVFWSSMLDQTYSPSLKPILQDKSKHHLLPLTERPSLRRLLSTRLTSLFLRKPLSMWIGTSWSGPNARVNKAAHTVESTPPLKSTWIREDSY